MNMVCVKLKHGNDPDSRFNPKQLKGGIKVELEHTRAPAVAKQIAKAHLVENPRYYTYLEKMEKSWHQRKHIRKSKKGKLFTAGKKNVKTFLKWQQKNRKALIRTLDKTNNPALRAVNLTFKAEDKLWDKVIGGAKITRRFDPMFGKTTYTLEDEYGKKLASVDVSAIIGTEVLMSSWFSYIQGQGYGKQLVRGILAENPQISRITVNGFTLAGKENLLRVILPMGFEQMSRNVFVKGV